MLYRNFTIYCVIFTKNHIILCYHNISFFEKYKYKNKKKRFFSKLEVKAKINGLITMDKKINLHQRKNQSKRQYQKSAVITLSFCGNNGSNDIHSGGKSDNLQ